MSLQTMVGIKMSWLEKNRKINNREEEGGERDDYSGLESMWVLEGVCAICANSPSQLKCLLTAASLS